MKLYWVKTGRLIKWLFGSFVWDAPPQDKTVYLTFDDGPTPNVTNWVLEVLKQHNIKATFFCIGKNIEAHPDIFKNLIAGGHSIGNHTFNHLNGWATGYDEYIKNMEKCEIAVKSKVPVLNKLFRPPYGKISRKQAKTIRGKGYKIVMWDVLSADFDQTITVNQCLSNVINNTKSGSIIIFHDSVKAENNLRYTLPKAIEALKQQGYTFGLLT